MTFFSNYKALIFYGIIILLLYLNRKKFEIHAKIIALYKTKIGLRLMDRLAEKYREIIKIYGYCGIGIGFGAMIFMVFILVSNLFSLIIKPDAVSGVSLAVPGVKIPGSVIVPPLMIGWIALFIIIVIHEFSHGVVARAHNVKVKSSGILFFGPIMGAFVEPDERSFAKEDPVIKYSVYAAGSFSNIVFGMIVAVLISIIIFPIEDSMTKPVGFSISGIMKDFPAEKAGMKSGEIITGINGNDVTTYEEFQKQYKYVRSGDEVKITTNKGEYTIKTVEENGNALIGISGLKNERDVKSSSFIYQNLFWLLSRLKELLTWVYIFSLGIGIANLLPLGPIDGGRMLHDALKQIISDKKRAVNIFAKITGVCIILLLLNIFYPGIKYLAGRFFNI